MKKLFRSKLLLLVIVFSAFAIATDSGRFLKISQSLENFADTYRIINHQYVDETDANQLMRIAIDSMLAHLDPYTNYYSEAQMVQVRMGVKGGWDGIGVELIKHNGKVVIRELIEGTPAEKKGLRVGDVLLKIEGTSFNDRKIEDISKSLQGKAGTKVTIEVLRPSSDKIRTLTLERVTVTKKNVPYFGMLNDETGYIILTTFSPQAGANVQKAFEELQKNKKFKNVILDLRENGGGYLIEAVNICNIFLNKGIEIVYTRNKIPEWDRSFKTINAPVDTKIPVIVLMNGHSASASEIVAGALQDVDRALLLGNNSFGKGLVQNTKDIGYSSKVKLTTAKYYIPSGRCVQALNYKNGIPVKVPDSLRKEFKTMKGREVYDGNGLEPDLLVEDKKQSPLLVALMQEHLIFDFANIYRENHDSILVAKEFELSDSEFDEFVLFAKDKWYEYKTSSEVALLKLEKQAKTEGTYSQLSSFFDKTRENIIKHKQSAFKNNYSEIKQSLEQEIVGRFYFMKGQVENRLADDFFVKQAIDLFADEVHYNHLLRTGIYKEIEID
jgi:carboxyl-terminal processing protease